MEEDVIGQLERRLGRVYASQRLGIERDHEDNVSARGRNLFDFQNWRCSPFIIRSALKATGLYWRGERNAERIEVRTNIINSPRVPHEFDGFVILQISDLHADMNGGAMRNLAALLPDLKYDICVLTGDYRGRTFGRFDQALDGLTRVCDRITRPVYGVLGNHDTIRMVPGLEQIGIRMLLNETVAIEHSGQRVYLAGIDDAHYYRVDNIEKAVSEVSGETFSILLSHTPEVYRQAAHAGFDLLLSGHTHGGQICLPGSIPIVLEAVLPRRMASGAWRYHNMAGYTSVGVGTCVVPVRFNCPPEVTLHQLRRV